MKVTIDKWYLFCWTWTRIARREVEYRLRYPEIMR